MKYCSIAVVSFLVLIVPQLLHAEGDSSAEKAVTAEENLSDSTTFSPWNSQIVGGLTMTQAHFDNWERGGENTLAWQISLGSEFIYYKGFHRWTTTSEFKYGETRLKAIGTRKSTDEIRMESVYQYMVDLYVNPFASVNFQSQFTHGYRYLPDTTKIISSFMDPGILILSAGAGSTPYRGFNTRLGAAYKMIFVDEYARRLTDGRSVATEFGVNWVTALRQRLAERMLLTSRLEVFSNLKRFDDARLRWDIIVSAEVTRFIDVRLNTEILYDRSFSRKRQFKQVLAAGFTYTII